MFAFIALVGAPNTGKTAIAQVLEERGYTICKEAARDVLSAMGTSNTDADIDFLAVQRQIFATQLEREDAARRSGATIAFCDRAFLDNFVYLEKFPPTDREGADRLKAEIEGYDLKKRYKAVFFVLPHSGEYTAVCDKERTEDVSQIIALAEKTREVYVRYGYDLVDVPQGTPQERASFILSHPSVRDESTVLP